MRTDELDDLTLQRGYQRLQGVFGPPKGGDVDGWKWGVKRATRGWTSDEFAEAVKDAAVNCRYFPRPADLLSRRPAKVFDPTKEHDGQTCRRCEERYRYAGYQHGTMAGKPGRVYGRLRCGCPKSDPGWDTDAAESWEPPADERWMIERDLFWTKAAGGGR